MKFFNQFKSTRLEQLGLIILLCLFCFGAGYLVVSNFVEEKSELSIEPIDEKLIDSLLAKDQFVQKKYSQTGFCGYQKRTKSEVSKFNPNDFQLNDWVAFGFSKKQASALLKYKTKIKGFKSIDDFKKAYVVNDFMLVKIKKSAIFDSIQDSEFSSFKDTTWKSNYNKVSIEIIKIDINTASAEEFKKLKGIGDVLSKRIIKYRNGLGGFYSISQINEVYGVHDSVFQFNRSYFVLNEKSLKKININEASRDQLKGHPYLSWKEADKIINYRKDWGKILDSKTIKKENLIPEENLKKLLPYIEF